MSSSGEIATGAWALRLPLASALTAASLRLVSGIEAAEDLATGDLWLRGRHADEDVARGLRGLPATERYTWLPDDGLRPIQALLVVRRLPTLTWQPLRTWAACAAPPAALPARRPPAATLRLAPAHLARAANAALVARDALLDWMLSAPALRLARLTFAVRTDGAALVLGAPLPPLPGRPCVEDAGVVVPAGLAFSPAVSSNVVRQVIRAPHDAIVLWDENGPQILGRELFVPASRGAARATRGETTP